MKKKMMSVEGPTKNIKLIVQRCACRITDIGFKFKKRLMGWSGVAMVLSKFPDPGRPANLDNSRAMAYCAYSRCWYALFGHFLSSIISLFFGDGPM